MPRLVKRISQLVKIPEKWEYNPKTVEGVPILDAPVEYELGGGEVRIFSLTDKDFAELQDDSIRVVYHGGETGVHVSQKKSRENTFVKRLGGDRGSWAGFENEEGEPLNCTEKNQREFAHFEGLRLFVCNHVGPMLDKKALGKAEESEKNLLKSLEARRRGGKHRQGTEAAGLAN